MKRQMTKILPNLQGTWQRGLDHVEYSKRVGCIIFINDYKYLKFS